MNELLLHAFTTLFVVIDPIGQPALFAGLTQGSSPADQRRMAVRGAALGALILFAFAFAGNTMLEWLGVGLPAFRIAGGILLLLLAIDMLFARDSGLRSTTESEQEEAGQKRDISVFPLAIPLIAGPGAMTSVVLLMGQSAGNALHTAAILGVLALVLLLTLGFLLLAIPINALLGVTGANVISRVLGIVLAALAVQFMLDGIGQALPLAAAML